MTTRQLLLVATFAAVVAAPFSAMAGVHFVAGNGEPGYKYWYAPSALTRAEKQSLDRAQRVAGASQPSDWRLVGGKGEWVYEGHKYEFVGNKFVCVDGIDHNTKPSIAPLTDATIYHGGA